MVSPIQRGEPRPQPMAAAVSAAQTAARAAQIMPPVPPAVADSPAGRALSDVRAQAENAARTLEQLNELVARFAREGGRRQPAEAGPARASAASHKQDFPWPGFPRAPLPRAAQEARPLPFSGSPSQLSA